MTLMLDRDPGCTVDGPVPPNPSTAAASWRLARSCAANALALAQLADDPLAEWSHLQTAHRNLARAARLSVTVHLDPAADLTDRERVEGVDADRDALACVTALVLCAHARAHHSHLRRGWWPDLERLGALPLGVLACAASPGPAVDTAYRALVDALLALDVDPDVIVAYSATTEEGTRQ